MDQSHTAPFFLSVPRWYGWRSQTGADKLEPVCTVGLSVPVWDRSRTDPLSCVLGLNVIWALPLEVTRFPAVKASFHLTCPCNLGGAVTLPAFSG